MMHLAMCFLMAPEVAIFSNYGMWIFLSIGAVALFVVFIPTVTWLDSRRKEREAYYRAETLRRITEASSEGAMAAIELLREEERIKAAKKREGMKIGGVSNICVGIALLIFLHALDNSAVYLCGLFPGLIGVGLLVYVYLLAPPVADERKN